MVCVLLCVWKRKRTKNRIKGYEFPVRTWNIFKGTAINGTMWLTQKTSMKKNHTEYFKMRVHVSSLTSTADSLVKCSSLISGTQQERMDVTRDKLFWPQFVTCKMKVPFMSLILTWCLSSHMRFAQQSC